MNLAKILSLIGVIACVLLLVLVGIRFITWSTFWIAIAILAGFAYLILPRMKKE